MNADHADTKLGGRAAAEALAFIESSRVRLAAASHTPPSRHLAFAAMMGGLVATPVLPEWLRFVALAGLCLAVPLMIRWDRRRSGMFVNGYRAGATRRVTLALLATILPLYAINYWLVLVRHQTTLPILLALAAGGLAYAGSLWWCRVFEREMLGEVA